MKRILILLAAVAIVGYACSKEEAAIPTAPGSEGPFLAATTPTNKNAVLEDFTGVRCQFCPDGHDRAKAMVTANPGRVVVIAINSGQYATPASGWPNFTSDFGDAIRMQTNLTGYPAGTVNRRVFSGMSQSPGGTAMGRGNWSGAGSQVIAEVSPVNLGASSTYDAATRKVTVKVDMYYSANETVANYLNVAFLESGQIGKQSNTSGTVTDYVHDNILRHMITGQWGEVVDATKTKTGTKITKTYTYTVPVKYHDNADTDINKCDIAVFVTRGAGGTGEILTGIKLKAK
jgi:hypothetical protein